MSKELHQGYRHPFLIGTLYLGGVGDNPRTLQEQAMCQLSAELRVKEDWWIQFRNSNIRHEWAEEAYERVWKVRTPSTVVDIQLSKEQVNYVLDELVGYDRLRDKNNRWQVSCFDRIWESGCLLDATELHLLTEALYSLREASPLPPNGSEGNITETLIDPLLYCLVYDTTLVCDLPLHDHLRPEPPPHWIDGRTTSGRFALLPSDVFVTQSGSAQFLSYINNLDPRHRDLYRKLEVTFSAFLPMFEHVLTDLHRENPLHQRIKGTCRYTVWEEPDSPVYSDDEDGWAHYQHEMREWMMNRPICLPDVPESGYLGGLEFRNHNVNLRERTVQVIVNVSETRLRPGGPGYLGSPWHVEGMRNERIVACALYYTSVDNLTDNAIEFRMAVTYPRGFSPGDIGATMRTWGLTDGDSCHQYIGSVHTRTGLGLVFPNIYQHRHTPFQLLDPSKEGHQTVVSFFLVDPEIQPIISTSSVAPQQEEWIGRALEESVDLRIPVEIVQQIVEKVEGLMSESEAMGLRQEILEERSRFTKLNDSYHFCIPFDV